MSTWPPPQNPLPIAPAPKANNRAGCGKAVLATVVIALGTLLLLALVSRSEDSFIPVLERSVGVIRIEGPITDSVETVKLIKKMRKNEFIPAIVVRLETPGGGVGASEEIYREVLKAKTENQKPVIVSMGNVAASGGYYIAAASDHIFATSSTITGSIGVVAPNFNAVRAIQKLGLEDASLATGEHKNSGSPFDEQTTSDRVMLQGVINDMYRQFFQVVLSARHTAVAKAATLPEFEKVINPNGTKADGMGIEWNTFTTGTVAQSLRIPVEQETALRRLADGRIYTGEQALHVGLVDTIGTLQDAIDYAGKAVDLGVDPPVVDRTPKSEVSSWLGASIRGFLREISAHTDPIEYRVGY